MNKKVSIIIPVYNQEVLVKKTLDSIPARDDIEVICVDDKSTDKSLEVLKSYDRLPLVIVESEVNGGAGIARNKGLDVATGEYIMFLDSDDYIYPDKFNLLVDNYLTHDIVFYDLVDNRDDIWHAFNKGEVDLVGMVKFIKKSVLGDLRFPEIRVCEDYHFSKKLLSRTSDLYNTKLTVVHYNNPRVHSKEWERTHGRVAQSIIENDERILSKYLKEA